MGLTTERIHVFIEGRVQGVGFRFSTRNEACRRGLSGWVRNLHDGRVEAVFEGTHGQLESMLQWCHMGPPGALVRRVEYQWEIAEEQKREIDDFRILF